MHACGKCKPLYLFCFLGKSDPFVVVHMLPVDLFTKAAENQYKTDIKKQTLEPFFNSKFDMLVIIIINAYSTLIEYYYV